MSRVDGSSASRVIQDGVESTVSTWSSAKIAFEIANDPSDGDVSGPASSTANAVVRFNGTTGKLVKNTANLVVSDAGAITVAGAYTLPITDGSPSQRLTTNGAGVVTWETPPGDGDVVGPESATDNALCRFDMSTGKAIQNSSVTLDDTGILQPTGDLGGDLGGASNRWQEGHINNLFVTNVAKTEGLTMTDLGLDTWSLTNQDGTPGQTLTALGNGQAVWSDAVIPPPPGVLLPDLELLMENNLADTGQNPPSAGWNAVDGAAAFSNTVFRYGAFSADMTPSQWYAESTTHPDFGQSPSWTMCLWFRVPAAAAENIVVFRASGGAFLMELQRTAGGALNIITPQNTYTLPSGAVSIDTWYHVALSYQVGGEVVMYFQGTAVSSFGVGVTPLGSVAFVDVGRAATFATYTGYIDNFRVYPYALNIAQVNQDLNNAAVTQTTAFGTVPRLGVSNQLLSSAAKVDDAGVLTSTGLGVTDQYTLPLEKGPENSALSILNGTVQFRGVCNAVLTTIPEASKMLFEGNITDTGSYGLGWVNVDGGNIFFPDGPYSTVSLLLDGVYHIETSTAVLDGKSSQTFCMWVYPTSSGADRGLFGVDGGNLEFQHRADGFLNVSGAVLTAPLVSGSALPLNEWTHICLAWQNGGTCTLYINGVAGPTTTGAISFSGTAGWRLGQGFVTTTKYEGAVDDLKFYDALLNATQVFQVFSNADPVSGAPVNAVPTVTSAGTLQDSGATIVSGNLTVDSASTKLIVPGDPPFPPAAADQQIRLAGSPVGIAMYNDLSAVNADIRQFMILYCDSTLAGGVPPLATACWDLSGTPEVRSYLTGQRNQMAAVPNGSTVTMLNVVDDAGGAFLSSPPETGIFANKTATTGVDMGFRQKGENVITVLDAAGVVAGGKASFTGTGVDFTVGGGAPKLSATTTGALVGGDLNMQNNNVINVATPTLTHHATNKAYVDAASRQQQQFGYYAGGTTEKCMIIGGTHSGGLTSGVVPTVWIAEDDITIEGTRLISDSQGGAFTVTVRVYVNGVVQDTYVSSNVDTWSTATVVADADNPIYIDALDTKSVSVSAGDQVVLTGQASAAASGEINMNLLYRRTGAGFLTAAAPVVVEGFEVLE